MSDLFLDTLWQQIREEAAEAAQSEPVLASVYHANLLKHDSLEAAMAFQLAGLMGNSTLPEMTVREVIAEAYASDPAIGRALRADLLAVRARDPACAGFTIPILYFKGFQALQVWRIAHWLWTQDRRSLALLFQHRVAGLFDVDIHPAARLGRGILIDHGTGVVIGETAVVGDDVSMLHGVTLGGSGQGGDRHPKIGNGVLIATGARVMGNVRVGEGAKIAAGSVVLEDVPPHCTVAGVPARIVGQLKAEQPALDMNQQIT